MIPYEAYKVLHIFFIVIVFTLAGLLISGHSLIEKKSFKIVLCVFTFLIMVAGMGLIARMGYKHSEPFPLWIKMKFFVWGIISALLVGIFKTKDNLYRLYIGVILLLLALLNIWVAVYKPL